MSDQGFSAGENLPIMALANDEIVDAPPTITIREAASKIADEAIGLLLLREGGTISGVLSERDIVKAVAGGLDLDGPVSAVANDGHLFWAEPTATVAEVAAEMMESYVRHVLIAGEDGEPAGIASMRDLLSIIVP